MLSLSLTTFFYGFNSFCGIYLCLWYKYYDTSCEQHPRERDANKRFLYDVGVYDSDDDENVSLTDVPFFYSPLTSLLIHSFLLLFLLCSVLREGHPETPLARIQYMTSPSLTFSQCKQSLFGICLFLFFFFLINKKILGLLVVSYQYHRHTGLCTVHLCSYLERGCILYEIS